MSHCFIVDAVLEDAYHSLRCWAPDKETSNLKLYIHVISESAVFCSEAENDDLFMSVYLEMSTK